MMEPDLNKLTRPLAEYLMDGHMERYGIGPTMRFAEAYNRLRDARYDDDRRAAYQRHFDALLEENGAPVTPPLAIRDGYVLDTSHTLPHLDRLLAEADAVIARRGGVRRKAYGAYRSFFQNIVTAEDLDEFPSIMDFALSSDVLRVVGHHLKCVPILSATIPEGIRFMESSAEYDDSPGEPHDSQLYHIDYYARPMVYVLVLLHDVRLEHGPWCWMSESVTRAAVPKLNYWVRGRPYRLTDQEVHAVVDPAELMEFSYPRGTVLFIEPTSCLHYGSRNSVLPRYMLMYGYMTAIRTDLSEVFMTPRLYPVRPGDSRLRQMVLRKEFLEKGGPDH